MNTKPTLSIKQLNLKKCFVAFWSLWTVHAFLRILFLARVDAFGNPMVEKFEWYIFHALFIDLNWLSISFIPLFVVGGLAVKRPRIFNAFFYLTMSLQFTLLIQTIIGQEFYRFMGMHFDLSMMNTYGNVASVRETLTMLSGDASIPYLGLVSISLCLPFYFLVRTQWDRVIEGAKLKHVVLLIAITGFGWLFVNKIWDGGFREKKLTPAYVAFKDGFNSHAIELDSIELLTLSELYQKDWMEQEGDSGWVFSESNYPYYKTPLHVACVLGKATPNRCAEDRDLDGFLAAKDCNDLDSLVHPDGIEIPRNGIDENCDGKDDNPPNFVVMFLESHRAVNAGFLQKFGAHSDGTPFLNRLAKEGHFFARFNSSGLPTIGAFIATQLGLVEHADEHIATNYTQLKSLSYIEILRKVGYHTRFFSSADPSWDGQSFWLNKWYDSYHYERSTENDSALFEEMTDWMKKNLSQQQPFLISGITKSNHYPFNEAPTMTLHKEAYSKAKRMVRTMEYTERHMEKWFDAISHEKWFDNTIFLIFADHGFHLGERGAGSLGVGLYAESVWIPFVIYGKHPLLKENKDWTLASFSQIDVAPSLLDLAGVSVPNSFMGHSFFRKNFNPQTQKSWQFRGQEVLVQTDQFKIHFPLNAENERTPEMFNMVDDPLELNNLISQYPDTLGVYQKKWLAFDRLHNYVIENNKFYP